MTHPFRCQCGRIAGEIIESRRSRRLICYCKDCQAYAHALGKADQILDEYGGTEVVSVRPRQLRFTRGMALLRCLSLSEKGLLRWYAGCCGTALANTPRNPRIANVGLMHTCITGSLESSFGPVRFQAFRGSAVQRPPRLARN